MCKADCEIKGVGEINKKGMMLVVTHKKFDDSNLPIGYQVICVGNEKDSFDKRYLRDDDGEDVIANQNEFYSELTAQYWAYKNTSKRLSWIGICHYRRYFMLYRKNPSDFWSSVISLEEIESLLQNYDIIVPYKEAKIPGSSLLVRNLSDENQDKNWIIIRNIIYNFKNDYKRAFDKVIYGKRQCWYNMFVAKKSIFDEYSRWLFEVLSEYDKHLAKHGLKRTPRVDGYLSELLILVWLEKNIKKNRVAYLDVRNSETEINIDDVDKLFKLCRTNPRILKIYKECRLLMKEAYMIAFKGL